METIINNLSSIGWWISVVIIGIIVNIIAAYLKPILDRILARYSEKYKTKIVKNETEMKEQINKLIKDKQLVIEAKLDLINDILKVVITISCGLVCYVVGSNYISGIPMSVIGLLFAILVIILFRQALVRDKYIQLYEKRKKE